MLLAVVLTIMWAPILHYALFSVLSEFFLKGCGSLYDGAMVSGSTFKSIMPAQRRFVAIGTCRGSPLRKIGRRVGTMTII